MVRKADIPNHLIETALRLAAERGWARLSYGDIAAAAEVPLSKAYPVFSSKAAILDGFAAMIDAKVLEELDEEDAADDGEGDARDRLFDVLMSRFEALQPYRQGLGNILYDLRRDPCAALQASCALRRSMALMLELAGLSADGPTGLLRVKGLAAIYLASLRVWLRDDSLDLAKTMAALDGYLRRVEGLMRRVRRGARRGAGSAAGEDGPEVAEEAPTRP